jgi:hypothetical protein
MKSTKKYALLSLIIVLFLMSGCYPAPSKDEVEEVIIKHFETKKYKIVELSISDINPYLSEKNIWDPGIHGRCADPYPGNDRRHRGAMELQKRAKGIF